MKKSNKKQIKVYIDDGHTIYDMSGLTGKGDDTKSEKSISLSRKEKHAAIRAALITYLPALITGIVCFGLTMLLMRLWLM